MRPVAGAGLSRHKVSASLSRRNIVVTLVVGVNDMASLQGGIARMVSWGRSDLVAELAATKRASKEGYDKVE